MATMMSFVLMELVRRADAHCPGSDPSVFKVYGILVAGRTFELCVETVMMENVKISFVFHHNNVHWKFELFGTELVIENSLAAEASNYVTEGPSSILSRQEGTRAANFSDTHSKWLVHST